MPEREWQDIFRKDRNGGQDRRDEGRGDKTLEDVMIAVIYKVGMAESSICKTQEANARKKQQNHGDIPASVPCINIVKKPRTPYW